MTEKTELVQMKLTPDFKKKIQKAAKSEGLNVPQFMAMTIEFFMTFNEGFLSQMAMTAEKMKLSVPITIQNFLQAYMAHEAAALEMCGSVSRTFKRAFQFDAGGLIMGNRLSEIIFEQEKKDMEALEERLRESAETGEPAHLTVDEKPFLAAHADL